MERRTFLATALAAGAAVPLLGTSTAGAAPRPAAAGISWPSGQALPGFAAPSRLATADLSAYSAADQLTLISLQGIVNRTQPRIYLLANVGEGKATWQPDTGVPNDSPSTLAALVARYRSEVKGAVIPDPALPQSVSVATTLAGLEDALIATPEMAASLGLPIIEDLRGRFTSDLAASQWQIDTLWPRTTHRMVISMNTSLTAYLRDYAIANRALTVWLDHSDPAQKALIERLADDMPDHSPYMGWLRGGESPAVETLSNRSCHVLAADTAQNLSVWSGVPASIDTNPYQAATPALQNKIYVTLTYSDGDNLQYAQHKMRQLWDDPARGQIPVNWPVPPEILDAAPALYAHYQRTATTKDYLLSGPSGLGYVFPSAYPAATFDSYVSRTADYTRRLGMNSTAIINRLDSTYEPLTDAAVAAYAKGMAPLGIFQNYDDFYTEQLLLSGTPIARSRLALDQDELHAGLTRAADAWTAAGGKAPVFTMVFLHAWTMTPSDAAAVAATLDDRFVLLRGEQFFGLVKKAGSAG
ncbi:GxGYxYP domain-containing protein [Streptomyces sp. TS71-3]|uniref:GxGYxYP domain-containing protein n=1 Tax=Streptomyces sp. TS71-3 TaxID=2733862 RepID=UPI001B0C383A|nr:GxGYxYP domain-containing protein [Streptomyces sp. TS71-3]GHJ37044.1 hypothetical protein Sm713_26530 [Streptomyces sp. TS71-3]